ncbi:MAG: hypothetical protein ACRD4J_01345 [Nitrososphaeraceae archaeon]
MVTESVNISLTSLWMTPISVTKNVSMSAKSKFLSYNLRSKNLAANLITTITLVAIIELIVFENEHNVNAQIMGENHGDSGNMNTSLTQAMTIAEQSVDNNSSAIAGFDNIIGNDSFSISTLGEDRAKDLAGNLVHSIILDTPGTDFYHVIVDSRNGQVLAAQKLSQKVLENMHLEHSRKVLAEPHLMNNTFVH